MATGFKEWSLVCEFLRNGAQSLLLRKGGIAEGREGFQFRHGDFFLFPTRFHEQEKHLSRAFLDRIAPRGAPDPEGDGNGEIPVSLYARVVRTCVLHEWEAVRALAPFHGWSERTVRERFEYKDAPGISVAVLRVYTLAGVWRLSDSPRYGGCRSWLELPECPEALYARKRPVLEDEAFATLNAALPLGERP